MNIEYPKKIENFEIGDLVQTFSDKKSKGIVIGIGDLEFEPAPYFSNKSFTSTSNFTKKNIFFDHPITYQLAIKKYKIFFFYPTFLEQWCYEEQLKKVV